MTEFPSYAADLQRGIFDWKFRSTPQEYVFGACSDREINIPRGKVIGGTSVLNYMIWVRGNRQNYDHWDKVVGGDGLWSFDQVFPYYIRMEDVRIPEIANNGMHGKGGPITIEFFKKVTPTVEAFLAAGRENGYPTADYHEDNQASFFPTIMNLRDGFRCSTAKGYLRGIDGQNRNLDIILGALVTKVIIDKNNRAVGVMFDRDESSHKVYAKKEVILSAGTVSTPQILMLSGIGDCSHLNSVGVPCQVNLPAVGQNLQEHWACYGNSWLLDNAPPRPPLTAFFNPFDYLLLAYGRGPLVFSTDLSAIGFFRSKYVNESMPPDLQIQFSTWSPASDGGLATRNVFNLRPDFIARTYLPFFGKESFAITVLLVNPKSRGTIKLRDNSPYSKPIIDYNGLSDPRDVKALIDGNRFARKLAFTDGFKRLGVRDFPVKTVGCEHLEFDSDQYHECVVRTVTFTDFHPVGTCAMGSCVDKKLRVKGVKNLRVADASVMPTITTGNTNAPSIMIGEKLADILQDKKWYNTVGHKLKPGQVFPGE